MRKLAIIHPSKIAMRRKANKRIDAVPEWDEYFMGIAIAASQRANCLRGSYRVGAVLIRDQRIISTGYNGTPSKAGDCLRAGCHYCYLKSQGKGASKETCTCVHAEQNALLASARFGIAVDGSIVYTTVEPCFTCSKELLQAKVRRIVFCRAWGDDLKVREREALRAVQARFPDGVAQLDLALPLALKIEYSESMRTEHRLAA